jgi:hypothetical protein
METVLEAKLKEAAQTQNIKLYRGITPYAIWLQVSQKAVTSVAEAQRILGSSYFQGIEISLCYLDSKAETAKEHTAYSEDEYWTLLEKLLFSAGSALTLTQAKDVLGAKYFESLVKNNLVELSRDFPTYAKILSGAIDISSFTEDQKNLLTSLVKCAYIDGKETMLSKIEASISEFRI